MEKMTVRTIAKALGVAHSTVHRALSGKDSVSLKNRRRIIQYAQEHGYRIFTFSVILPASCFIWKMNCTCTATA